MNLIINNQNIQYKLVNEKNLIDVLESTLEWLEENNHIAKNINVNNKKINFIDKNSFENLALDKIETIVIESEHNDLIENINEESDPKKWFNLTIKELTEFKTSLSNISVFLQTDKKQEAYNIIINFTTFFNKISRLLKILIEKKIVTDEEKVIDLIKNLNNIINEINFALENDDNILLGDLFEYEINPIIDEIYRIKF